VLFKRLAIVTFVLWIGCAAYVAAQPDPDVLEALRYLDRANGSLDTALSESERRQQIAGWITSLFREGEDAVAALRTELDEYEWANNPAKVILGIGQDVLGTMFPFLALGAGLREKHWRKRVAPGKAPARQARAPEATADDPVDGPHADDPVVDASARESQRARKIQGA
jgi:hypothetical protein